MAVRISFRNEKQRMSPERKRSSMIIRYGMYVFFILILILLVALVLLLKSFEQVDSGFLIHEDDFIVPAGYCLFIS